MVGRKLLIQNIIPMKKTKIAGISSIAVLVTAIAAFFLQPTPKPLDLEMTKVEETAAAPKQVLHHVIGTTNIIL